MDEFKDKYDEAIRSRADAFMKILATGIVKKNAEEYEGLEYAEKDFCIPHSFDVKMREQIKKMEREDKKSAGQKRLKSMGRVAALIILCLVTTCSILTVTVDAFRFRLFDFLKIEHDEYIELIPTELNRIGEEEKAKLPAGWTGTFYPEILPEGYELTEVTEAGAMKGLTFVKSDSEYVTLTIISEGKAKTGIDSENVEATEVDVNGTKGTVWEKDGTCLVIWFAQEQQFNLFSDSLKEDEMLEIAKSIKYLRIK